MKEGKHLRKGEKGRHLSKGERKQLWKRRKGERKGNIYGRGRKEGRETFVEGEKREGKLHTSRNTPLLHTFLPYHTSHPSNPNENPFFLP